MDLRHELERLAQADPQRCGFIVCGIGNLEDPMLRFAAQAQGIMLAGPWEVISLPAA